VLTAPIRESVNGAVPLIDCCLTHPHRKDGKMKARKISKERIIKALKENNTNGDRADKILAKFKDGEDIWLGHDSKYTVVVTVKSGKVTGIGPAKRATYDRRKRTVLTGELCKACKKLTKKVNAGMCDADNPEVGISIASSRVK